MQRFFLNRRLPRGSSSCLNCTFSTATDIPSSFASLQEQYRRDILNTSLHHVHQHGWTEDAIAYGVVSNSNAKYPPSFIGMMNDNHSKSSDLIHYFMKESNLKLKSHLDDKRTSIESEAIPSTHSELLKYCIQYRLKMVIPYVLSNRWSEGMALGATPYNAMSTASHLDELVSIIEGALLADSKGNQRLNPLERTAIGAVYVTTELHLLADSSPKFQDTWKFLNYRIQELDMIQQSQLIPQFNQETMVAGFAVASSLGGAVLSLMTPLARNGVSAIAGTIVPEVMNAISYASSPAGVGVANSRSSTPGAMAKDYNISDLPPFDLEDEEQLKNEKY